MNNPCGETEAALTPKKKGEHYIMVGVFFGGCFWDESLEVVATISKMVVNLLEDDFYP